MPATVHLYEIFIRAPRERVWDALLEPAHTTRYLRGLRLEGEHRAGAPFRWVHDESGAAAIEGVIETFDPPHRLAVSWLVVDDAAMAAEPPGRVEWTLTAADREGSVTRVTLRHGDLALSPRTWSQARLGWVAAIDSLKSLLETGQPLPEVETGSPLAADDVESQWHRAQAVTAHNSVWEYLDGRSYAGQEADELLSRAYAARYHWARADRSGPINIARAAWLLSRAHAVLGHGELALHHAVRCAELTDSAGELAADFDRAYAHEATARALACLGRLDEARREYDAAVAVEVADPQDRAIVTGDLAAPPWYGLAG